MGKLTISMAMLRMFLAVLSSKGIGSSLGILQQASSALQVSLQATCASKIGHLSFSWEAFTIEMVDSGMKITMTRKIVDLPMKRDEIPQFRKRLPEGMSKSETQISWHFNS